ncbi:G protein-activated inward rectifier potassium channel 3-like isoform X2 [Cylas formicarius]|uniref:G protein-activated inward rectifier potassium channel 3-like isoform X2 n=1 Tax=Cylas formicarius TaxID=197179 RepID=UPI0029587759|nr:G protein-activated inward rectifier potassium channel 3-like isoform X2 [Cylas formicarius]
MPREMDIVEVDEPRSVNKEFYPFYLIKRRSSVYRSRSSLQSLQLRNKVRLVRRLVRKSGFWAIINIEDAEIHGYNGTETCLGGINSFAGYLLFSIETQTSIGYGGRYITEYCPEAVTILCIQLIVGIGIGGTLTCVVYLKMEGPLRNLHSLVCFSKKAVICQRDGALCLIFRVRDCDKRHEAQNKIVAYVVENHARELSLKLLTLQPTGILIWPIDVVHKIDRFSPFWDISAKDLMVKRFEIIVVMEGSSLATSYMSRTTTSYLSREVKWGHKFRQCTTFDKRLRKYKVNHDLFHRTEEVVTPLCSAKRLYEVYDDVLTITSPSTSVYESSKYSSPVLLNKELRDGDGTEDEGGQQVITSVQIHREDNISNCSSDEEPDAAFMELSDDSLTDLSAVRRSDRSGVAQNLLNSLQKFVPANVRKSWDKNYKETAF